MLMGYMRLWRAYAIFGGFLNSDVYEGLREVPTRRPTKAYEKCQPQGL